MNSIEEVPDDVRFKDEPICDSQSISDTREAKSHKHSITIMIICHIPNRRWVSQFPRLLCRSLRLRVEVDRSSEKPDMRLLDRGWLDRLGGSWSLTCTPRLIRRSRSQGPVSRCDWRMRCALAGICPFRSLISRTNEPGVMGIRRVWGFYFGSSRLDKNYIDNFNILNWLLLLLFVYYLKK